MNDLVTETSQPRSLFVNLKADKVIGEIRNKIKQKRQENYNLLSYYPHQIEKHNNYCICEMELASRKRLRSCEIILKAASLADHE